MKLLLFVSLFYFVSTQSGDLLIAVNELRSAVQSLSQQVEDLKTESRVRSTEAAGKLDGLKQQLEDLKTESRVRSIEAAGKLDGLKKQIEKLELSASKRHVETTTSLQQLKVDSQRVSSTVVGLKNSSENCCLKISSSISALIPATTTAVPTPPTKPPTTTFKPYIVDCSVHERSGSTKNGVYRVGVHGLTDISVWCQNGYTLLQRRQFDDIRFDKTWVEYSEGFGKPEADHWMGLKHQHVLTRDRTCQLQVLTVVDAKAPGNIEFCRQYGWHDCNGQTRHVTHDDFRVSSAVDNFRIRVKFNSTDFIHPTVTKYARTYFNGFLFSTKDRDLDTNSGNCAENSGHSIGGGFWYKSCSCGFPNIKFLPSSCSSTNNICANWHPYYVERIQLQFRCV